MCMHVCVCVTVTCVYVYILVCECACMCVCAHTPETYHYIKTPQQISNHLTKTLTVSLVAWDKSPMRSTSSVSM